MLKSGEGLDQGDELECRAKSMAKKNRGMHWREPRQGPANAMIDWRLRSDFGRGTCGRNKEQHNDSERWRERARERRRERVSCKKEVV